MMYLMAAVFVGWTIGVVAIVIDWRKDCKEIGRVTGGKTAKRLAGRILRFHWENGYGHFSFVLSFL